MENIAQKPGLLSPLSVATFHPAKGKVGFAALRSTPVLINFDGQPRRIAEQACGSQVTYIWGPPGTGKTYTIAHLVTALIEAGERVLVCSHTHAAVDQALYEAVKPEKDEDKEGPLANHPAVAEGTVLRMGITPDKKIPSSVRFDAIVEERGRALTDRILELTRNTRSLLSQRTQWLAIRAEWDRLEGFLSRLKERQTSLGRQETEREQAETAVANGRNNLQVRRAAFERAQRAWFWREMKTAQALQSLQETERQLQNAERALTSVHQEIDKGRRLIADLEDAIGRQQAICGNCPPRQVAEQKLAELALELEPIEQEIRSLQEQLSQVEQQVIAGARAVFCTLTALYVGNTCKSLEGQSFDAVIVDEISMALPPLIFLAAARAARRVVLVGDFLQLPPIVRGDTPVGDARLGKDTFELAAIVKNLRKGPNFHLLAKLDTQWRMRTEIADVARYLVYTTMGGLNDHPTVSERKLLDWLEFLPENPLVVVDTADLHCWSGKQPGSLSRFNFDSAKVAVEIAALAAARLPKPSGDSSLPIGIVSPFTAQRRLLTKLIADLDLKDWVVAGTVHTFQGGQANLIIFDSVLDEPYYTARLCTPRDRDDVRRELNVAVTRARDKFVFVGSSEWLNKHAKSVSGLGQMWAFLTYKDRADLIPALELVRLEPFKRVFDQYIHETGWSVPHQETGYTFEHLDETSFFERFTQDLNAASDSIFGLAPYFGEYRWPRIQPVIGAALKRHVKVTLVTPPLAEAENRGCVEKVIKNLRDLGAVVVSASGLHGKDVIIDEKIIYTGSMNWSSNRGRSEEVHRIHAPQYAKLCLQLLQAKHIRQAATYEDGTPRVHCDCGWPVQIVNQRRQHFAWDFQAMKVGCTNPECDGYLRNVDERPPFKAVPVCEVDGRTKYRRVHRGRGEIWQCPKHPRQCPTHKVVPGDPA
ncbi:MAG: AAA domain-containing protein [Planctomycetes bacterium]|nr:AAA domain-containing protein [Planctomycetota bacterium]